MSVARGLPMLRRNRRALGETYQSLMALTVVIMCVALVLSAVNASSTGAARRASESRAHLQADIALGAIATDAGLCGASGDLDWTAARAVASGAFNLSFRPSFLRVVTLRAVQGGPELFLVGNSSILSSEFLFASRPVAIDWAPGEVRPGILRVGVVVEE